MKNLSLLTAVFFCFIMLQFGIVQSVNAQSSDKIDFYVDAGVGIPAAPVDFTQYWKIGYGIGAGASYVVQPNVKIQLYGQYHRFGFDEEGAKDDVSVPNAITSINGATADLYSLMLNIIYEFVLPGSPTTTYFSIGSGYIGAARNDFTVTTSDGTFEIDQNSGSSLGVNGAVGLRHAIGNSLSVYAEAKFVTGLFVDRRTQYVPISLGVSF